MLIASSHLNVPVSDALYDFTKRRITRALRAIENSVSRVEVHTEGVNGPGGVIEVECTVSVELPPGEQPISITSQGADAYAAILAASARLHECALQIQQKRRAQPLEESARRATPPRITKSGADEVTDESAPSSDIVLTATDQERLRKAIQMNRDIRDADAAAALADELDRAKVVSADRVAGNVVTMNSRITFRDEGTGERREVSLVYPEDSNPAQGRISVFAPVGAALLGLSVGQTIDWPLPEGQLKRYRVVEVVYQPEAAGHLNL